MLKTYLFLFVFVNGEQIFVQKILPELNFRPRQVINFATFQVLIFYPVGVDQIIALSSGFWKGQ